jgi:16S rRNA (guanine527-N7)-methyltransferase
MAVDKNPLHQGSSLDLEQALRTLFAQVGGFTDEQVLSILGSVRSYLAELTLWNPKLGLVEALDDVIPRHVLDCLAPVSVFRSLLKQFEFNGISKAQITIADLGSGAGLPGLLLSLVLSDYSWDLVESMGRRVSFLENARIMVAGSSFQVVPKPFQQLPRQSYDLITNRAFQPLTPDTFLVQTNLLKPGAVAVWYKARFDSIEQEAIHLNLPLKYGEGLDSPWIDQLTSDGLLVLPYTVSGLDAQRHLVLWRK